MDNCEDDVLCCNAVPISAGFLLGLLFDLENRSYIFL
jgi:hypothetical protein